MFFLAVLYGLHLFSFASAQVSYDCLLEGGNFTCTETIVQCNDEEGCTYQCYEDTCHTVVFDCSKYPCRVQCSDQACVDMAMVCNPFDAEDEICAIKCLGTNSCRYVNFELGTGNIEVDCIGQNSCRNISLTCETEDSCMVNCANGGCEYAELNCGSQHQSCGLTCQDESACSDAKLFCTSGMDCNLNCVGDGTCSNVIQSCTNTTLCGCTGSACGDIIVVRPEPSSEPGKTEKVVTITKKEAHWGYIVLFTFLGFAVGIGVVMLFLWYRKGAPLRFKNLSSNSSHPQTEGMIGSHIKNSEDGVINPKVEPVTTGHETKQSIMAIPRDEQ